MPNPETSPDARPLRSLLYMPASNRRAIDKARGLDTDAVALDLEDAVAPEMKAEARATLLEELAAGGFGHRRLIARINALATPWGQDDLTTLATAPVEAVLVPKVDDADDVIALSRAMGAAGYAPGVKLWVMIETPRAVLALERIAACAATTRLAAFVLGLNELAKDTGMTQLPGRAVFLPVLTLAVLAARAHGLAILDGVCNAIDDSARLEAECVQARDGGFDGKTLIHPAQVATANAVFAPDEAELAQAQAIIAAFALPENQGRGAIQLGGRMVELLHAEMAKRVVALAEAIAG